MSEKKIMGQRIRERREACRLSQDELADLAGYSSKSAISRIEGGQYELNQRKIAKFAEILNTSAAYLMGWTDSPLPRGEREKLHNELISAFDNADSKTQKAVMDLLNINEGE